MRPAIQYRSRLQRSDWRFPMTSYIYCTKTRLPHTMQYSAISHEFTIKAWLHTHKKLHVLALIYSQYNLTAITDTNSDWYRHKNRFITRLLKAVTKLIRAHNSWLSKRSRTTRTLLKRKAVYNGSGTRGEAKVVSVLGGTFRGCISGTKFEGPCTIVDDDDGCDDDLRLKCKEQLQLGPRW